MWRPLNRPQIFALAPAGSQGQISSFAIKTGDESLDTEGVKARLKQALAEEPNQRAWAKKHRVSQATVSLVLTGVREPSDSILAALGLRRVVTYEPIQGEA